MLWTFLQWRKVGNLVIVGFDTIHGLSLWKMTFKPASTLSLNFWRGRKTKTASLKEEDKNVAK